jgi:hypothetical protein
MELAMAAEGQRRGSRFAAKNRCKEAPIFPGLQKKLQQQGG